jgi:hypothetical protein
VVLRANLLRIHLAGMDGHLSQSSPPPDDENMGEYAENL